jgi:hypothetical protein
MMTAEEIQNRISLKELIDKVSILGDKKNYSAQVQLFSKNAISETIAGGSTIMKLKGRKEMADAFDRFLKDYHLVYHFNGQQQLTINENKASGTVYCLITLMGHENGTEVKTTVGAVYEDNYILEDGSWLIEKRIGHFQWQEKTQMQ